VGSEQRLCCGDSDMGGQQQQQREHKQHCVEAAQQTARKVDRRRKAPSYQQRSHRSGHHVSRSSSPDSACQRMRTAGSCSRVAALLGGTNGPARGDGLCKNRLFAGDDKGRCRGCCLTFAEGCTRGGYRMISGVTLRHSV
jgi:hypothetical protein